MLSTLNDAIVSGQFLRHTYRAAGKARLIPQKRQFELGLVERPHYAFGLRSAALEAKQLGYSAITAIEFGVAGGNGLLTLEEYARTIEAYYGITVNLVGFDTGVGLPPPSDFRDVPFLWSGGDFAMDEQALRQRLTRSDLILGDVRDTVKPFVENLDADSPVGFVSFDLDFWSSTMHAFEVFRGEALKCLPRVWCYFDDIVGLIPDVGELLAIDEFNRETHGRRIRHPHLLRQSVPFKSKWADQMYQAHLFDNSRYNDILMDTAQRVLPLQRPK